jgi:hypothetical protein
MAGWVLIEEARPLHLNTDQLDADGIARSIPCQVSGHGTTCRVVDKNEKQSLVSNCPDCNPDAEMPEQRDRRIKRERAQKKERAAAKVAADKAKLYGPRAEDAEDTEPQPQSLPYKDE